jgi:peptide/nickel transport system substrate-binding protein
MKGVEVKKLFLPLAILLLIALLLPASCGSSAAKGGVLKYLSPYSPSSIPGWPNDNSNAQRLWMEWTVFEPLIRMDKQGNPVEWLATGWEWGPQKSYITFTLRQNVKFHDGTPFTSEAVKLEADICMSTNESITLQWDRWEVLGDYSIRLYLKEYLNDFWANLIGINMCFISPAAYKANGKDWMMEHPIGTGPFKFESFEKDVIMKWVKNTEYWQSGKPYLDGIDFITVKEPLTQQTTMQAGGGDILAFQQGKTLYDMKQLGFNVISAYGGTDFLMFDTMNADSVYNDVRIRQAIEYAINKQAIVDALGYGYYIANNQMSPPDNPSYYAGLPSRIFDQAKARELLKAAGKENGFECKILTFTSEGIVVAVQAQLKAVGIDAQLDVVDNIKYWNYMMAGWSGEMVSTGYSMPINYASFLKGYFPPTGIIDVSCKIPDSVLSKMPAALREQDPAKAKTLYDELIKIMYDEAILIPICSNSMGFITTTKVHNTGIFDWVDWSEWTPADCWMEP